MSEDPRNISELFARDPLSLTKEDIDHIIEAFRAARHTFNLAGKTPTKRKKKEVKVDPQAKAIFDDLFGNK